METKNFIIIFSITILFLAGAVFFVTYAYYSNVVSCDKLGFVCGVDGVTYVNECSAFENGTDVVYNGKCFIRSANLTEDQMCDENSGFVCGKDGVNYESECEIMLAGVGIENFGTCKKEVLDEVLINFAMDRYSGLGNIPDDEFAELGSMESETG